MYSVQSWGRNSCKIQKGVSVISCFPYQYHWSVIIHNQDWEWATWYMYESCLECIIGSMRKKGRSGNCPRIWLNLWDSEKLDVLLKICKHSSIQVHDECRATSMLSSHTPRESPCLLARQQIHVLQHWQEKSTTTTNVNCSLCGSTKALFLVTRLVCKSCKFNQMCGWFPLLPFLHMLPITCMRSWSCNKFW